MHCSKITKAKGAAATARDARMVQAWIQGTDDDMNDIKRLAQNNEIPPHWTMVSALHPQFGFGETL
jgi:mevalonate pyrophosphate decarboxylase